MSQHIVSGQVSPSIAIPRLARVLIVAILCQGTVASPAKAATLPEELLGAATAMPPTEQGRKRCAKITIGMTDGSRDLSTDIRRYTADARGVYLAQISAGISAGPFIQALLDAGAAKRLRLTREGQPAMDVFILDERDAGFFEQYPGISGMYGSPPPLDATGTVPSGLRTASHFCWILTADRVLEFADPMTNGNGTRWAAASILFHTDNLPAWITDWRVIQALSPNNPAPREVKGLVFRDDGDGWRPEGQAGAMWDIRHWHAIEAGDDGTR